VRGIRRQLRLITRLGGSGRVSVNASTAVRPSRLASADWLARGVLSVGGFVSFASGASCTMRSSGGRGKRLSYDGGEEVGRPSAAAEPEHPCGPGGTGRNPRGSWSYRATLCVGGATGDRRQSLGRSTPPRKSREAIRSCAPSCKRSMKPRNTRATNGYSGLVCNRGEDASGRSRIFVSARRAATVKFKVGERWASLPQTAQQFLPGRQRLGEKNHHHEPEHSKQDEPEEHT
jgi:hypothetical protein